MARLARLYAPSVAQHVVHTAVDGRRLFVDADDYSAFVEWLREAARTRGVHIHAFVLLPERVELVGTPQAPDSISRALQDVARRFVPRINAKTDHVGTLWRARYRSTLIEDDLLLAVMRYVESRPVMEGLAGTAASWKWSSFAHHIGQSPSSLVVDHALYWALSDAPFERQAAYRASFEDGLDAALVARIRNAVMSGWALGSERFVEALAIAANRRPRPRPRGRVRLSPPKTDLHVSAKK